MVNRSSSERLRPQLLLFTHHDLCSTSGVIHSVREALKSSPAMRASTLIVAPQSRRVLRSLIRSLIIDPVPAILFNGGFSLVHGWGIILICIWRLRGRKSRLLIYWHETSVSLRRLQGYADWGRRRYYGRAFTFRLVYMLVGSGAEHCCVSPSSREAVLSIWGGDPTSYRIVGEAVTVPVSSVEVKAVQSERKLTVASAGLRDWRKGADLFADVAFTVGGKMSGRTAFYWYGANYALARPQEVADLYYSAVHWFGWAENFPGQLGKDGIQLFVSTARDDPFPIAALEALSLGIDTWCLDTSGLRDILSRESVFRDVSAMSDALIDLLEGRRQLAPPSACIRLAESFTPQRLLEQLGLDCSRFSVKYP